MHAVVLFSLIWILSSTLPVNVNAREIDDNLILTSIELFPRIVAVDLDIDAKLDRDGEIILIVYYNKDQWLAEKTAEYLTKQARTISGRPFKAFAVNRLPQDRVGGILIVERLEDEKLREIVRFGIDKGVIVFSPFREDVAKGITAGFAIDVRTIPVFNRATLSRSGIRIHDMVLRNALFQ